MTPRLVVAISNIHIGLVAGSKGDKLKGQSPTPPKTIIAHTGTAFTPRTDAEEAELFTAKAVRYPNPGEDTSRFPQLDLKSGEVSAPVVKPQSEIDAEAQETQRQADAAEKLRLENVEKAKKAAADQAALEDKNQKDADDKMRADAKKAEDAAAAELKKKEERAAKAAAIAASSKPKKTPAEQDADAAKKLADKAAKAGAGEQEAAGEGEQEDVV